MERNGYKSSDTYQEILRQATTWRETIKIMQKQETDLLKLFNEWEPKEIVFSGSGTSYYLAISASRIFQEITGIPSKAIPSSEVFLDGNSCINSRANTLLIGISRSGDTSETIYAGEYVKNQTENNANRFLAVTGYAGSDIDKASDYSIVLPQIAEKGIVMTGSFTSMLLSLQLLAGIVGGNKNFLKELFQLPIIGEKVIEQAQKLGQEVAADSRLTHFIYLGLGSFYGLACEGMLKMKEMTQSFSEAFSSLEFRHGPISVLNESCSVILLSRKSSTRFEQELLEDIRSFGAHVIVIGDELSNWEADWKFELGSMISDQARHVLYLPILQLLSFYRTIKLGLDPDHPRFLNHVVNVSDPN